MKQLELLSKKQKIIVIGVFIFIIAIIGYYFYLQYQTMDLNIEEKEKLNEIETIEEEEKEEDLEENIIIHISGAVINEGIVNVKEGARISDVIEKAGGLRENASLRNVNLAYMVEDGQKIYIPTKEEEAEIENEYTIIEEGNNTGNMKNEGDEEEKVNINKATQTELEQLPGIGSATALKIIQYREENGEFKTIEDIKNVNGIGDSKFNNIKEFIEI